MRTLATLGTRLIIECAPRSLTKQVPGEPFFLLFFFVFSVSILDGFGRLWGAILGVLFDDFFCVFFSMKTVIDVSIDFSSIFGRNLGGSILENGALAQAKRSFSKNRLFRFWHDFRSEFAPKRLPKYSTNGLKNRLKYQCIFSLKKVPIFHPKWSEKRVQRELKIEEIG